MYTDQAAEIFPAALFRQRQMKQPLVLAENLSVSQDSIARFAFSSGVLDSDTSTIQYARRGDLFPSRSGNSDDLIETNDRRRITTKSIGRPITCNQGVSPLDIRPAH
jgi:hypothetical protein